jgi:hypothetical protein
MTQSDSIHDFLNASGAKGFDFDAIGATCEGEITDLTVRQQTDMQTKEPAFWDDGKPKNALVITVQTDAQDDDADDGQRTVWIKGGNFVPETGTGTSSLNALKDAMRAASVKDVEVGGQIRVVHSGIGKAKQRGFNPPKLYEITYHPPTRNVSLDDLG